MKLNNNGKPIKKSKKISFKISSKLKEKINRWFNKITYCKKTLRTSPKNMNNYKIYTKRNSKTPK